MDASAILARIQNEKGGHLVEAAFDEAPCWITTVNACEVLSKLYEKDAPITEAQEWLRKMDLIVVDFDLDLALRAAAIRMLTKPIGASLGDRACLALAQQATAKYTPVVYTTEQSWTKIKWPFKVVQLRMRHESTKQ